MKELSKLVKDLEKADWRIPLEGPESTAARDLQRQMKKSGLDVSDREARDWVREARKAAR